MKYKHRYPVARKDADGKPLCRGCGNPVPKGRQSWCGDACYGKFCPAMVISKVKERDKGICQICQQPTRHHHPKGQSYIEWLEYRKSVSRAEYDHIIPMAEGGLTVLENIRTLFRGCHKKRTAEWRKSRASSVPQVPSVV